MLEDDLGRDLVIPYISKDRLSEDLSVSHDLPFLENEDTSIEATRALFRWVLDNSEGRPPEDAYKDPKPQDLRQETRYGGDCPYIRNLWRLIGRQGAIVSQGHTIHIRVL